MTPVRLKPGALRSRVKHSTTEPLRSPSAVNKDEHLFLPFFILMDYPIHKDTISIELPILYFKGSEIVILQ